MHPAMATSGLELIRTAERTVPATPISVGVSSGTPGVLGLAFVPVYAASAPATAAVDIIQEVSEHMPFLRQDMVLYVVGNVPKATACWAMANEEDGSKPAVTFTDLFCLLHLQCLTGSLFAWQEPATLFWVDPNFCRDDPFMIESHSDEFYRNIK
jgi:hypothetical protein